MAMAADAPQQDGANSLDPFASLSNQVHMVAPSQQLFNLEELYNISSNNSKHEQE